MASHNRLAGCQSPYLLQHADNPVDWFPWGDEAFAAALSSDRPVFLSIGYATCHWCHVMAHESFEDPIVAALMNEAFVNVKVDREERPDIDQVYMAVCQMLTGSGGWPLTIIMTPDRRPFFAGTYLPRTSRFGRLGMLELVPRVQQMWTAERQRLIDSADEILGHLRTLESRDGRAPVGPEVVEAAARELASRYDGRHGGFGSAPKFPSPHTLLFLLERWRRDGNRAALEMATTTLSALRRGGIYDHVGFGFHRYSTDSEWLVPHFEKMLYDQAMHVLAASEAFAATGSPEFERTAREVIEYVQRDLRSPEGAFYSAEDADSEGEEGRFYVWALDEVQRVLPSEQAELAAAVWRVLPDGNWRDESTGRSDGTNIPHLVEPLEASAARMGMTEEILRARLDSARRGLLAAREQRERPLRDDKILTDWNGLMAAALARAGRLLGEPSFVAAAGAAVTFIHRRLRAADGRLLHAYREGHASVPAFLDDFACLTWAELELYDATFDPSHLEQATILLDETLERFWDPEGGAFNFVASDHEPMLIRHRDGFDGAMPSGNSMSMWNLLRVARLTGRADLEARASQVAEAFGRDLRRAPSGHAHMVAALAAALAPSFEVVVVGAPGASDALELVATAREHAGSSATILFVPEGPGGDLVRSLAPFTSGHHTIAGRATAYLCRDFVCHEPTTDPAQLAVLLARAGDSLSP